MAVIIIEKKIMEGKEYIVKIYRTQPGKLVTHDEKVKAEKLDNFLSEKMKEIKSEIRKSGLIRLKGKKGKVLKLWYEIGKRLDFVMDTSIIAADDREFVWRAIYDHAGELAPGLLTKRAMRNPETSHFSYCYQLSRFPWEFVEFSGDWTSWSEFFDRSETRNDPRVIEWLGEKAKKFNVTSRQNWLRPLTKAIHNELGRDELGREKDTTLYTKDELYEQLESIFLGVRQNERE